jgi:hypothetical protein
MVFSFLFAQRKRVTIREFRAWLLKYWGSTVETKLALRWRYPLFQDYDLFRESILSLTLGPIFWSPSTFPTRFYLFLLHHPCYGEGLASLEIHAQRYR